MAEKFDPTGMREITITDPDHIFHNGVLAGMQIMEERIRKAAEQHRIAGLGMATSIAEATRAEFQLQTMARNIRAAVKAGANLATESVAAVQADKLFIRPLDLLEQAGE